MPRGVILTEHGRVAVITLNRPPRNLVDSRLLTDLNEAMKTSTDSEDVEVVVITGGDKVFSEGLDLEEFQSFDNRSMLDFVKMGQQVIWRVEHARKPTIAAMAGKVLGAGLELALSCDMRLAAENSQFGHPEVTQGLFPLFGNTFRLERLIGRSRARSMILVGEPIPAWEALEIGLVGKIAPNDVLREEARIAAGRIVSNMRGASASAKASMLAIDDDECRKAMDVALSLLEERSIKKTGKKHSTNRE